MVAVLIALVVASPAVVRATGETITGGADVSGVVDTYTPINDVQISGTGDDVIPVDLYVPSGSLSMTTTTGLTFTTDETGSHLNFSGARGDVNTALATLRYRTDRPKNIQLAISLTGADTVYNPVNGHLYEVVQAPDDGEGSSINWVGAKAAAEGRTLDGLQGYLVTITSAAENQFIKDRVNTDSWIGASDDEEEGVWKWVTGPEAGQQFWEGEGNGNGQAIGGRYNNWHPIEPNNSGGENCAEFYADNDGQWNDLSCENHGLESYIVEYGSDSQTVNVQTKMVDISISYPEGNAIPVSECPELADIAADPITYRYDHISLTQDIDCEGASLEPLFNYYDEELGWIDFRGSFNGNNHTITGYYIDEDQSNLGLFGRTLDAAILNLSVDGIDVSNPENYNDCTGALIGYAQDTTITNVHFTDTSVDSLGGRVGGLVGCYDVYNGTHNITGSSYAGSVDGGYQVGGLVGEANVGGANSTIGTNTASVYLAAQGGKAGGMIGGLDIDDEAQVYVNSNQVSNTTITSNGSSGGLVGEIYSEDGANLTTSNNNITTNQLADDTSGGLVGYYESDDAHSYEANTNTINSTITADTYSVGGLFGSVEVYAMQSLNVDDNDIAATIVAVGDVGGMIGYLDTSQVKTASVSRNTISGLLEGDDYLGGIAGELYHNGFYNSEQSADITFDSNTNTQTITSTGSDVGGMIGYIRAYYQGTIIISKGYVAGDVSADEQAVGGMIGYIYVNAYGGDTMIKLQDSYVNAAVSGSEYVGGAVGYTNISSDDGDSAAGLTLERIYSYGSVSGNGAVGGLLGYISSIDYQPTTLTLKNSFSAADVASDDADSAGGLIGYFDHGDSPLTTSGNYYDKTRTGQSNCAQPGDIALSCTAVNATGSQPNYFRLSNVNAPLNSWNFGEVWGFKEDLNDGFPCLQRQTGCVATEDGDGDGISDIIEQAGPHGGDANNDDTPDSDQSNVSSFVNPLTGEYVVLAVDDTCNITSVSIAAEDSSTKDNGYDYPAGLMDFTINCGTQGFTANIAQYYYGVTGNFVVRKYNPSTHSYAPILNASVADQTIAGNQVKVASYQVTDGSSLDLDGTSDGSIHDPAGLAQVVTSSGSLSNTGQNQLWLYGLIAILLTLSGLAIVSATRAK